MKKFINSDTNVPIEFADDNIKNIGNPDARGVFQVSLNDGNSYLCKEVEKEKSNEDSPPPEPDKEAPTLSDIASIETTEEPGQVKVMLKNGDVLVIPDSEIIN